VLEKYKIKTTKKTTERPIEKVKFGVVKSLNKRFDTLITFGTRKHKKNLLEENNKVFEILRKNLKERLSFLGLSLNKVAKYNGYSRENVSQWLKSPRLKSVVILANMVGVPVHQLISPDFDPKNYGKLKDECNGDT
jgi:lambda repressor-like predicted transcriptional regulator